MNKFQIRAEIKRLKQLQTADDFDKKSQAVCLLLSRHKKVLEARTIMSFWPMNGEIDVRSFNNTFCQTKTLVLPVLENNLIKIKHYNGNNLLRTGQYGILEPDNDLWVESSDVDLVIVPGTAFDKQNNRLGLGKAFYDKFLVNLHAYKLGICFDFQLLESIPAEKHDIPVDEVLWS